MAHHTRFLTGTPPATRSAVRRCCMQQPHLGDFHNYGGGDHHEPPSISYGPWMGANPSKFTTFSMRRSRVTQGLGSSTLTYSSLSPYPESLVEGPMFPASSSPLKSCPPPLVLLHLILPPGSSGKNPLSQCSTIISPLLLLC